MVGCKVWSTNGPFYENDLMSVGVSNKNEMFVMLQPITLDCKD
jgi:hypothetical protein